MKENKQSITSVNFESADDEKIFPGGVKITMSLGTSRFKIEGVLCVRGSRCGQQKIEDSAMFCLHM